MKQKILLFLVAALFATVIQAQKNSAYAITAPSKGQHGWTEVRMVDLTSGEEIKTIYRTNQEVEILNARSGKPVVQKESAGKLHQQSSKPFATFSAACAYDKKHERLYYTPMGISQLRYIDLKSKTPKIYYFEEDGFGVLKNSRDIPNQITRMVIASDGNGYALTNDGNHLYKFTTSKRPVITDLGALTDDPSNTVSIHFAGGYGGDMIADTRKNLYLVTAFRHVFKIEISSRTASYLGMIRGLPRNFTTNAAVAGEGSNMIVGSSNSTAGYFSVDINTLQAEKITSNTVYNASDLANSKLLSAKMVKEKEKEKETVEQVEEVKESTVTTASREIPNSNELPGNISVYPNPASNGGIVKLSFEDQPQGRYEIQFMDVNGKIMRTQQVAISGKNQVEEFKLPPLFAAGNYLIKVMNIETKAATVSKLVVQ